MLLSVIRLEIKYNSVYSKNPSMYVVLCNTLSDISLFSFFQVPKLTDNFEMIENQGNHRNVEIKVEIKPYILVRLPSFQGPFENQRP